MALSNPIYLVNLDNPEDKLSFQWMPTYKGTITPSIQELQQPSRNNPNVYWTGSKETLELQATFTASADNPNVCRDALNKLKAWCMDGGPKLVLVYGTQFKNYEWRVQNLEYDPSLLDDDNNYNAWDLDVTIRLIVANSKNLTARDVIIA